MDNWGAYAVCRSRFGHLARSPPDLHTGGCVGVPSGSAVCAGSLGTRGVPTRLLDSRPESRHWCAVCVAARGVRRPAVPSSSHECLRL